MHEVDLGIFQREEHRPALFIFDLYSIFGKSSRSVADLLVQFESNFRSAEISEHETSLSMSPLLS